METLNYKSINLAIEPSSVLRRGDGTACLRYICIQQCECINWIVRPGELLETNISISEGKAQLGFCIKYFGEGGYRDWDILLEEDVSKEVAAYRAKKDDTDELFFIADEQEWSGYDFYLIHRLLEAKAIVIPHRSLMELDRHFCLGASLDGAASILNPNPLDCDPRVKAISDVFNHIGWEGLEYPAVISGILASNGNVVYYIIPTDSSKIADSLADVILFYENSIREIEIFGGVRWARGVLCNQGLFLYHRYLKLRGASGSQISFKEYLQHMTYAEKFFDLGEDADEPQEAGAEIERRSAPICAYKEKRVYRDWTLERTLFAEWAKSFPENKKVSTHIPRPYICEFIKTKLRMPESDPYFQKCLSTLYKVEV